MSEKLYSIKESTMTAMADTIREITGTTGSISGDEIANYVVTNLPNSGGDTSMEDGLVTRQGTTYTNDRVTTIGGYAFYSNTRLTSVNFPACTSIGANAFYKCTSLTTVSLPICTSIGANAFYNCYRLKSLYLTGSSVCKLLASNAFT